MRTWDTRWEHAGTTQVRVGVGTVHATETRTKTGHHWAHTLLVSLHIETSQNHSQDPGCP